ncbi:hypothetical protein GCM10009839_16160 [Catenulispora yoronensis]|uniref:WD40-like Beta Propeller Repeat n=1 Tax=Catenulispora yoronensis TaxID=450799 RepID=A0ABP5FAZ3_9ACTN
MLNKHLKKSIAASAVLAGSVAAAMGSAGGAQAAPAGPANSPLTLDRGAWAPDGSRYAFVDADGAVRTQLAGGGAPIVVDPAKPGVTRSHPTWFDGGAAIVFSETANGASKLVSVPAYTDPRDKVAESNPITSANIGPLGTETAPDSNGKSLVTQHHNAANGHDEVWIQDGFGGGTDGPHLVTDNGLTPTLSPDGKTIVFVRPDAAGDQQLWSAAWTYQTPGALGAPVQLTHDAADHTNPTWSADGARIAFEQGPGHGAAATSVQSIAKGGGDQRQEADHAGVPNYQPLVKDTVTRLSGADRIGTALAASQALWPTAPYHSAPGSKVGQAAAVVLARQDLPFDALGGSTLAAEKGGPLLLTSGAALDPKVKAEIVRLLGPAATTGYKPTVYILGGEQAVSANVLNAVKAMGYQVKRLSGPDRYTTSVAIAKEIGADGPIQQVLVATGEDFPDALSAGAAADSFQDRGAPGFGVVVLSQGKTLPAPVADYVKSRPAAKVFGVGGQADTALTQAHVTHTGVAGSDRYQTSYLVAKTFFTAPDSVGLATGATFPDALSGGAFMSRISGPLLLVNPTTGLPSTQAQGWLSGLSSAIGNAYIFGGTAALGPNVATNIAGDISGPAGANQVANPRV